ncbi:hypothetical protein B296_00008911 [Ensete ventricosum]|uniref:Uncharacterized protein n=1 Tax=Ensete ventricosum TaxID=4639 RepID=A0A426ZP92_ENSVE|nr:hypothetical protein B296_00008911 [Ensete ventricosum]
MQWELVGSSSKVIGKLARSMLGVGRKMIERLIGSLPEDAGKIVRNYRERFAEGIGKLVGNVLGDCRKTCRKNVGGCQIGES